MHGADPDRVALVGSMIRTLTPTVNVGWVVAPRRLVQAVRTAWQRLRTRRNALMAALEQELPECRIQGAEAGMHLVLELPAGSDIAAIRAAAERRNMRLCDINDTRFRPDPEESLLQVGYGNLADLLVGEAMAVLADVIRRRGRAPQSLTVASC
jgi:GntR family transcriptional regulator / MocR family aminotransferase